MACADKARHAARASGDKRKAFDLWFIDDLPQLVGENRPRSLKRKAAALWWRKASSRNSWRAGIPRPKCCCGAALALVSPGKVQN
jgi:hypothetical protein